MHLATPLLFLVYLIMTFGETELVICLFSIIGFAIILACCCVCKKRRNRYRMHPVSLLREENI